MSLSVLMYEVSVQRLPVFLPSTFFDSISRAPYTGLFCPKSFFFPFHTFNLLLFSLTSAQTSLCFCSRIILRKWHRFRNFTTDDGGKPGENKLGANILLYTVWIYVIPGKKDLSGLNHYIYYICYP